MVLEQKNSPLRGAAGKTARREHAYFARHAGRMNYQELAQRAWPVGSGAVESARRQAQGRCKRTDQCWSVTGRRNLAALLEARANDDWDQLWLPNEWWRCLDALPCCC
jgi:hypothetical protein